MELCVIKYAFWDEIWVRCWFIESWIINVILKNMLNHFQWDLVFIWWGKNYGKMMLSMTAIWKQKSHLFYFFKLKKEAAEDQTHYRWFMLSSTMWQLDIPVSTDFYSQSRDHLSYSSPLLEYFNSKVIWYWRLFQLEKELL